MREGADWTLTTAVRPLPARPSRGSPLVRLVGSGRSC